MIAVSIYCCLIKYQAKQRYSLSCDFKNSELKKIVSEKWAIEDIDIKSRTYYFFDEIINTKYLDPNDIKIDEKSYKNIFI